MALDFVVGPAGRLRRERLEDVVRAADSFEYLLPFRRNCLHSIKEIYQNLDVNINFSN